MISVIIPAYNNIDSVRRLLASIYQQFNAADGEVVVVDDGSQLCDMMDLKREFPGLKVIRLDKNQGAANARNAGVRNSLYDIILFFDSDMELCVNVISEVKRIMNDPKINGVVGVVSEIPVNRSIFCDYWALLKAYFHSLPTGYSSSFYPMIGAIRKDVYNDVGGFDENIKRASIEDYEISMRLAKKGYKFLYNHNMVAKTTYKDFFTSLRQSIERAKKWSIMFLDRKKFDNHTTTFAQGMANICGFLACIFIISSLLNRVLLIPAAAALLSFIFFTKGFLNYVYKKRGASFLMISITIYLVSSFFITIGSLTGVLFIFRNKEARRRALYG